MHARTFNTHVHASSPPHDCVASSTWSPILCHHPVSQPQQRRVPAPVGGDAEPSFLAASSTQLADRFWAVDGAALRTTLADWLLLTRQHCPGRPCQWNLAHAPWHRCPSAPCSPPADQAAHVCHASLIWIHHWVHFLVNGHCC